MIREWRRFALVGRWDCISIEFLIAEADDDPNGAAELEELRDLLERIVPLPDDDTARHGSPRPRVACAGAEDACFRKFIREGRYDQAMKDVARRLQAHDPQLRPPADDADGPMQGEENSFLLLKQAHHLLDFLETYLDFNVDKDPDGGWLDELERRAADALDDAGIVFSSLDTTHVVPHDGETRWRQAYDADEPGAMPLRAILDHQDSDRRCHVWRAVRLLEEIEELRKLIAPVNPAPMDGEGETDEVAWTDRDMRIQSYQVGEAALRAGLLLAALDSREMELAALRHRGITSGASAGGKARSGQHELTRREIISAMEGEIAAGRSINEAAGRVHKHQGLGKSPDANRKLYERYSRRRE